MSERNAASAQTEDREDGDLARTALADGDAFALLYHRHVRRIFQYLLTYTGSPDDAADLTQVTFIRALQALPAFHGERDMSFSSWLTRIARNAAIDAYRRPYPVPWEHIPEMLLIHPGPGPEQRAVERDTLNRLRLLISTLDPEKQELLALRFAAGLTIPEIAATMGKSEAATRKQLDRTRQVLKERMNAYGL